MSPKAVFIAIPGARPGNGEHFVQDGRRAWRIGSRLRGAAGATGRLGWMANEMTGSFLHSLYPTPRPSSLVAARRRASRPAVWRRRFWRPDTDLIQVYSGAAGL